MKRSMELYRAEKDGLRLTIHHDECVESPRDWDNVGVIVGWHRRYIIGDEQPGTEPRQWLHEWRRGRKEKDYVLLPVYMIDHSGVALSTGPFGCPWDSGQVGWIYTTRQRADKMGVPWDREKIEEYLRGEIETYSLYMNGECYGFVLEQWTEYEHSGHWDHVDSCWGFLGSEWKENGMADHLDDDARTLLEEIA